MESKSGIKKVGVAGIGLMGSGIAQVASQCGFDTVVVDVNQEVVERGMASIKKSLDRMVKSYETTSGQRGITKEAADEALGRLHSTVDYGKLKDRDIIIEAITEDSGLKIAFNKKVTEMGYSGLFVSNTSSISISMLAAFYTHPEKYMGMHFMNPVPIQVGVEIIRGLLTSEETYKTIVALCEDLGKTSIPAEDKAGFGINRMFVPFLNEAVKVVEEGIMSPDDCDKTTLCLGHKMGPISTLDFVGLDTTLAILDVLERELGPAYKAAPMLKRLVESGYYGVKNGKGFFLYEQGKKTGVNPAVARYRRRD